MSIRSKAVPTFGTNQLYTAVLRKTAAQDIVWIATLVVSNQHNQKISETVISSNVLVIWQQIRKLGASQCINTVHEPTQNPLLMFSLHTEQISFLPKVYGIRPDGNHRSAAGCLAGSFVFSFFLFYFIHWLLDAPVLSGFVLTVSFPTKMTSLVITAVSVCRWKLCKDTCTCFLFELWTKTF